MVFSQSAVVALARNSVEPFDVASAQSSAERPDKALPELAVLLSGKLVEL